MEAFKKQLYLDKRYLTKLDAIIKVLETILGPSVLAYVIETKLPFLVWLVFVALCFYILLQWRAKLAESIEGREKLLRTYERHG